MTTYSIDDNNISTNGLFFSTLPNEQWDDVVNIMNKLAIDIESGVTKRIFTIYGARDYLSYTKAAIDYYNNLPALQEQYPELFI